MVPEEGVARLSLRPTRLRPLRRGQRLTRASRREVRGTPPAQVIVVGLPCVALFLLLVGAPRPFDPLLRHGANMKRANRKSCWPFLIRMVPEEGVEPSRPCGHGILRRPGKYLK